MISTAQCAALIVPGRPIPLQRAGRNGRRSYLPERSAHYRDRIQAQWMIEGRPRLVGPLLVSCLFYFATPRDFFHAGCGPGTSSGIAGTHVREKYRGALPGSPADTDNLVKAVLDALQDSGGMTNRIYLMFADDRQVVTLFAARRWAYDGPERTLIEARSQAV